MSVILTRMQDIIVPLLCLLLVPIRQFDKGFLGTRVISIPFTPVLSELLITVGSWQRTSESGGSSHPGLCCPR